MGDCCCKEHQEDEISNGSATVPLAEVIPEPPIQIPKVVDPRVIDHLILEMLTTAASRTDSDEESPVSLMKLHVIADKEDGWIQMVSALVNIVPLEDSFGPTAISILIDDCPLPSKHSVITITKLFNLSKERATAKGDVNIQVERNLCVTLGCIAEKLVGPNSEAILTSKTLDYLIGYLRTNSEPCLALFALIALEKFAHTMANKLIIKSRLEKLEKHPLLELEKFATSDDYAWRQVGFCAIFALDNIFVVEGRKLSYEVVDMRDINALLNTQDISEYLKLSANGLEARCDAYSFESVRCTFQVDEGCWYYECIIVTPGVMQIGWATKNSQYNNDEGCGIGDDLFSLSYDGCRRLIWYDARSTEVGHFPPWCAGDVLGCLIDLNINEAIFSLNGNTMPKCKEMFENTRHGFFAAASFMAFQHCRFNFGNETFKFPPKDRKYSSFNDHGVLTEDLKTIIPRRIYLERLRCSSVREDSCTLCCDQLPCCILEPCGHRNFCSVCAAQLKECPICRATILNVKQENT